MSKTTSSLDLSIVTTMYCSVPYLQEFYERSVKAAEKIANRFEIILVNDGSPDNSLELALELQGKDSRVKVVDLSRNFGHHKAIMTGLSHAKGDLVFLNDCDLEEEPELLLEFHQLMSQTHADVVYGVRKERHGSFFGRLLAKAYWRFFKMIANCDIPQNQFCSRLMTKRYVANLIDHRDREVFLPGLFYLTGFKQVPYVAEKLYKGKSTYTLSKRVQQFVNSITSFSNVPLIFIFYLGSFIVFCSGLAALYLILRELIFSMAIRGWPSFIVSVWLLGGLTIFCLGVIGIYLSKVFTESKQRPYTVVRQVHDSEKDSD